MKCPACGNDLQTRTVEGITVDVCQGGCGGIWFDAHELKKVDEAHEAAGEALLDVERNESVTVDHSGKRNCPKCSGMVMRRYWFSQNKQLEVDECPQCAGFWLDHGELGKIRSQYATEQERKQAAMAYFDELFEPQLKERVKERQEELAKARRVANMFRFICPSYYIPGKQEWGAF